MTRWLLCLALLAAPGLAQDKKISELPDGSPGQAMDAIPIARGGANYRLSFGDFAPLTGVATSGFRVYVPNQTTFPGSFAVGTGGANLINSGPFSHTGEGSQFFGIGAGDANTDAAYNTFVGHLAGYRTTTGSQNTFLGRSAGAYMTTGTGNTFLGAFAGQGATGDSNTVIGTDAGHSMTTADGTIIVGTSAATALQSGDGNVYIGDSSGANNVSSTGNTCVGFYCLLLGTGSNNIALGYTAGRWETGSYKLFIDGYSRASEADARANSLLYGIMGATAASQTLNINGTVNTLGLNANGTFNTVGPLGLGNTTAAPNTLLYGDAANTLSQRNGANGQQYWVFNQYTASDNFERILFGWSANDAVIQVDKIGGASRNMKVQNTTDGAFYAGTTGTGGAYVGTYGASGGNLYLSYRNSAALGWDGTEFYPVDDALRQLGTAGNRWKAAFLGGVAAQIPLVIKLHASQSADAIQVQDSGGTPLFSVKPSGMVTLAGIAFASLGTPANGTLAYCSDCTIASPCASSGTGALAKRLNGAWVCN